MYGAPGYSTVSYGPGGSVSTTTTTYGAPMMAPPMMMAGPPMMAPPMMAPPMMAGPMGYPAPPSMWRSQLNWNDAYSRQMPFVVPFGLPPDVTMRMMRASTVFRFHDRDWTGNLDFHEFALAMASLGYMMPPHELQRIFMMMDMDRSGRVNEREFCEFWGFYGY